MGLRFWYLRWTVVHGIVRMSSITDLIKFVRLDGRSDRNDVRQGTQEKWGRDRPGSTMARFRRCEIDLRACMCVKGVKCA